MLVSARNRNEWNGKVHHDSYINKGFTQQLDQTLEREQSLVSYAFANCGSKITLFFKISV